MLAALVAAPVLTLAGSLVQAAPAGHDTAAELASIAAHPMRYKAAGFLGFASMLLFIPGLLGLAGLVRPTRPRWAVTGLVMSLTGLLALTSLMGSGPVSQALAQASDRAAMVQVTDAYEGLPLTTVWVLLMLAGWLLGPLVLGLGCGGPGVRAVPTPLAAGLGRAVPRRRPSGARPWVRAHRCGPHCPRPPVGGGLVLTVRPPEQHQPQQRRRRIERGRV